MNWASLNWRRGLTRIWLLLTAVWFLVAAIGLASGLSDEPYPSGREEFLPSCAIPYSSAASSPFDSWEHQRLANRLDAHRLVSKSCERALDLLPTPSERWLNAGGYREACEECRRDPVVEENARGLLRDAQSEWIGKWAMALLLSLAAPFIAYGFSFLIWRLLSWLYTGFRT
jgi:hypothetical protein